ncbi:uncharacterized protein PHALS_14995 [Plasmopara halstedii]|uniref:Uncharacterized protein n=1 Tax=Plasmopara halstedii TaxID=4781 RepID=A0A0P1AZ26_PLAHL|nr:uncharacterized protein PHALS_14995 [Plasmopara halstedii]CEG47362.1 hypothetical protein PHALS_14995 [Plasmopara halstedii]|eukprot:XP_024583731.1 hypothetical protein PHALS_14995 [Plasmopara halstedii]
MLASARMADGDVRKNIYTHCLRSKAMISDSLSSPKEYKVDEAGTVPMMFVRPLKSYELGI